MSAIYCRAAARPSRLLGRLGGADPDPLPARADGAHGAQVAALRSPRFAEYDIRPLE